MDLNRLGVGERIAAVSGVALILIMFIFNWFSAEVDIGNVGGIDVNIGGSIEGNAWESFSIIDLILFVTALAGIGLAYVKASSQQLNSPVALSVIVAGLGILSLILIVFRIISPPDFGAPDSVDIDSGRKIGVWLGLIATGALTYGGFQAMQAEGTSFGEARDQLGDRMGGGGSGPSEPPSAPPSEPPSAPPSEPPSAPPPPPPPPSSGGPGGV